MWSRTAYMLRYDIKPCTHLTSLNKLSTGFISGLLAGMPKILHSISSYANCACFDLCTGEPSCITNLSLTCYKISVILADKFFL